MLVRALWDSNEDRPRALASAEQARDTLAAAGETASGQLAEVRRWLGSRRR